MYVKLHVCVTDSRGTGCVVCTHVCSNVQMSDTVLYQISDTPDTSVQVSVKVKVKFLYGQQ